MTAGPGNRTQGIAESRLTTWVVLLAAASPPLRGFVSSFVDNSQKVRDLYGQLVWVSTGDSARYVSLALSGAIVFVSVALVLGRLDRRSCPRRSPVAKALVLTSWAMVIANLLRFPQPSMETIGWVSGAALAVTAVSRAPIPASAFQSLGRLSLAVSGTNLLYYLLRENAATPCRPDKCSPVGELVRGYFPQENTLAIYLAVLLPFCGFLSRRTMFVGYALSAAAIAMTGSRAALAMLAAAIFVGLVIESWNRGQRLDGLKTFRMVRWFPLAGATASLAFYVFAPPMALTGRGLIYGITLAGVREHPFIGPGREVLEVAYQEGRTGGLLIAHEHGQLPYILTNGGALAFIPFVLFLCLLAATAADPRTLLTCGLAFPVSLGFATELMIEFNLASPTFFIVLVLASLSLASANSPATRSTIGNDARRSRCHA